MTKMTPEQKLLDLIKSAQGKLKLRKELKITDQMEEEFKESILSRKWDREIRQLKMKQREIK